jgi:zinc-binding alcohol dehydrogenase family protein
MAQSVHAVAYRSSLPIVDPESLFDVEVPVPVPLARDLLVRVQAVSVNPVDVKRRLGSDPAGQVRMLGWDAAGVVEAVGSEVSMFAVGDEVYYAGAIDRPGTNAQLHVVDERIVGAKPSELSFSEAAALPLTTLVAWESLFDRFRLTTESTGTLLVLGAAGGAGSMVVQLARALSGVEVVGTASTPASQKWVLGLGAHDVIDHHDLAAQVKAVVPNGVDYLFSTHSAGNVDAFAEVLVPGGEITAIDDPENLDLMPLKAKSISWHWELMFTRSLFQTSDMAVQHDVLDTVAELVDAGTVRTTMTNELKPFNAATMRHAHRLIESGHTVGKVVVAGF